MKKTNLIRRNSAGKAITKRRRMTLDEQLIRAIERKNIPTVVLESDGNGNIIIDKERDPELYDWAVNG